MSTADGRDTRWAAHRQQRRTELVEAAIRAIRAHGATVGMDEIAAEAGTSKTVVYRHLGDRWGLYLAVCESVDRLILSDFDQALDAASATSTAQDCAGGRLPADAPLQPIVSTVIDSYLRLVERDPELYRFVIRRPALEVSPEQDPVTGLTDTIAERLRLILLASMSQPDPVAAQIWAHALAVMVRESGDRWLNEVDRAPRADIVRHLARLVGEGLDGVLHPRQS